MKKKVQADKSKEFENAKKRGAMKKPFDGVALPLKMETCLNTKEKIRCTNVSLSPPPPLKDIEQPDTNVLGEPSISAEGLLVKNIVAESSESGDELLAITSGNDYSWDFTMELNNIMVGDFNNGGENDPSSSSSLEQSFIMEEMLKNWIDEDNFQCELDFDPGSLALFP